MTNKLQSSPSQSLGGPCGSILKTAVKTGSPGRQVSFGGHMQRCVINISAHGSFTVALLVTGHLRNAASNTGDKGGGGGEKEATVDDRSSLKANREKEAQRVRIIYYYVKGERK